jgi:hypothetical protein
MRACHHGPCHAYQTALYIYEKCGPASWPLESSSSTELKEFVDSDVSFVSGMVQRIDTLTFFSGCKFSRALVQRELTLTQIATGP